MLDYMMTWTNIINMDVITYRILVGVSGRPYDFNRMGATMPRDG